MKRRTLVLSAVALLAAVAVCFAATGDAFIGTWKLDAAKSKIAAGTGTNTTVVYSRDGANLKCVIDGTGTDGKPTHSEWTGKLDGKAYPVTGDPLVNMRSYRVINDHTMTASEMQGTKVVITARIAVSADGMTRTVTVTQTDDKGMKHTSTAVYNKQ